MVRPFARDDIPRVMDLHRRVFPTRQPWSGARAQAYEAYFSEMFFGNAWCGEVCPSLVWEDSDGALAGFLGVTTRTMSMNGRTLRVAVSSQFMVDERRRSTLAAVELVKTLLSGPQDLSMADEATEPARRLWESLGGTTALLPSLSWVRVLRPTRLALSRVTARRGLARAVLPLCGLADGLAAGMSASPLRLTPSSLRAEELDAPTLLECIAAAARHHAVRPEYDERSLKWLLDALANKRDCGEFQKVALRDAAGRLVGWYLAYFVADGTGEVLQVGARGAALDTVLGDLFHRAWRANVVALCGRLEPGALRQFSAQGCFFHHRGQWLVVHSRMPAIVEAIHRGDAFLTRLEGEWCLRFEGTAS